MTLRDDLEKAIALQPPLSHTRISDHMAHDLLAGEFLRDHGPALLGAVRDAERYRDALVQTLNVLMEGSIPAESACEECESIIRNVFKPVTPNLVKEFNPRRDAIDAAREGEKTSLKGINQHRGDPESPPCT